MFKSLTLTNFRKHRNLTIEFEGGLIAIRGRNEQGKTTIQEAIGYAMLGSKGLRQPLSEVVTWGEPDTSLKTVLTLGSGLTVSRSKRGAEITGGSGSALLVTGQTECTKYFEQLLGANADTAAKLMLASQGALRGALEGGPTEAAALIEYLADFDLIDRVIDLIQHELPTGNTTAAEAELKQREQQLLEVPEPIGDISDLEQRVESLNTRLGSEYEEQKKLSHHLSELDPAGARRFMQEMVLLKRDMDALDAPLARLTDEAQREPVPPAVGAEQIEEWRTQIMALKDLEARRQAYKALQRLKEPEVMWEGTKSEWEREVRSQAQAIEVLRAAKARTETAIAMAAAKKITETQCAFCSKDLTDVPEVVRRNIEADSEVSALLASLAGHMGGLAKLQAEYDELMAVGTAAQNYEEQLARFSAFTVWDQRNRYPSEWAWKGEVPSDDPAPDYNAMIRVAEAAQIAHQRALGTLDAARAQLADLRAKAADFATRYDAQEAKVPAVSARIQAAEKLERHIALLTPAMEATKLELSIARNNLERARNDEARRNTELLRATSQRDRAQQVLDDMRFHNALVKKVRGARGAISDKLWSIVLSAVSHHFSQIRGTPSIITRSENGFKCDGQAVQGLSGSTLDALGLAIRIALTKTFLPNSRFMLLDEPGSAADDERESNMLGLLAASDFDQILLVTHSALADSFASQVVQL